ncbi:MAG: sulfotransferase [Desulfobacteraceae bacterium]|nr:MAG: sulfotransferase [Desulfobacteraceae bacterium]
MSGRMLGWLKSMFESRGSEKNRCRHLFFIGNKRSGTTVLAHKINLHPDIFITHETDIIWILYNRYNGIPFEYYPRDEYHSTEVTLEKCRHILDAYEQMTPMECYQKCQQHLMKTGTQWIKPTSKIPLCIGDKKPNQQSEKPVNDWVYSHFPDTRYVHIVRNPFDFLNSIPRLLPKYDLGARYGSPRCEDPSVILETWAHFERLVAQEKRRKRFPIYTVRFEDFCERPAALLSDIWEFTGLDIPDDLKEKIQAGHDFGILPQGLHPDSRGNTVDVPLSENVREMMALYGYDSRR